MKSPSYFRGFAHLWPNVGISAFESVLHLLNGEWHLTEKIFDKPLCTTDKNISIAIG